jgi:hypothetical protein
MVLQETNVNQFEAKSSLYWTFHSVMTEIGDLFLIMHQTINISESVSPDNVGVALFLLFKLMKKRKNVALKRGAQNSIVSTLVLPINSSLTFPRNNIWRS